MIFKTTWYSIGTDLFLAEGIYISKCKDYIFCCSLVRVQYYDQSPKHSKDSVETNARRSPAVGPDVKMWSRRRFGLSAAGDTIIVRMNNATWRNSKPYGGKKIPKTSCAVFLGTWGSVLIFLATWPPRLRHTGRQRRAATTKSQNILTAIRYLAVPIDWRRRHSDQRSIIVAIPLPAANGHYEKYHCWQIVLFLCSTTVYAWLSDNVLIITYFFFFHTPIGTN